MERASPKKSTSAPKYKNKQIAEEKETLAYKAYTHMKGIWYPCILERDKNAISIFPSLFAILIN